MCEDDPYGIADLNRASPYDVGVDRQLAAELPYDIPRHIAVHVRRVGIDCRHVTAPM